MKKVISIFLVLMLMVFVSGCEKKCEHTKEEIKFKKEYESLNGKKRESDGKTMKSLTITEDNNMKYSSSKEVIKFLESGTGVIYFGFPDCPWCRSALPVFLDAAKKVAPCETLYFDALSIRDTKHLDDNGQVVVDQKGSDDYHKILELLGDQASVYDGLNDDSIKRLYFPTMVFVKEGKIVGVHEATVDSQEDPYKEMSKKQYNELKKIYIDLFTEIQSNVCSAEKAC